MAQLTTEWLGLELKNPLVLAACGLGSTPEGVRKAADSGFGAVVLKSLFEEQLSAELSEVESGLDAAHSEAVNFLQAAGMQEGLDEYCQLVRSASQTGIPVIASINCVGTSRWGEFARRVAAAGASALELNAGFLSASTDTDPRSVEQRLLDLVAEAKSASNLPVSVKLGPAWTSLGAVAASLAKAGVAGLVLFNRFYSLDIDLSSMTPIAGPVRSSGMEYHEALRWISILAGRVPLQFSASSGVHEPDAALKLIAAGAATVQLCSAVYKKGYTVAREFNDAMSLSLNRLGYQDIQTLRGAFAQLGSGNAEAYLRIQYVKALTGIY